MNRSFGGLSAIRKLMSDRVCWNYFRIARDSGTITKVSETTACRALANTRGKARLPKRKGAAITVTSGGTGTFHGRALAKAAVTITGGTLTGCTGGSLGGGHGGKAKCNQGVGNGPEGCDPGNSNQGDLNRSNDERGGTPGNPGRKGGNGK